MSYVRAQGPEFSSWHISRHISCMEALTGLTVCQLQVCQPPKLFGCLSCCVKFLMQLFLCFSQQWNLPTPPYPVAFTGLLLDDSTLRQIGLAAVFLTLHWSCWPANASALRSEKAQTLPRISALVGTSFSCYNAFVLFRSSHHHPCFALREKREAVRLLCVAAACARTRGTLEPRAECWDMTGWLLSTFAAILFLGLVVESRPPHKATKLAKRGRKLSWENSLFPLSFIIQWVKAYF